MGVLEKHFVKVAQAEEQEGILGQFAFDAAILRHHGSELRFGRHAAETIASQHGCVEMKFDGGRCANLENSGQLVTRLLVADKLIRSSGDVNTWPMDI